MTIWTWNYLHETFEKSDRGIGWSTYTTWQQAAPQNIERVVVRVSSQGIAWDQGESDWPIAAGTARLAVYADEGGGNWKSYYWASHPAVVWELSQGGLSASPPTKNWRTLQWQVENYEVDQTIRRGAPVPPAPATPWVVALNYTPFPYNNTSYFQYISDWWIDVDVWYLTSEPGT